jgi:hypothetical protein
LFSGHGMHGAEDARRLVSEFGRDDILLLGPVGTFTGVDAIVKAAVTKHVFASTADAYPLEKNKSISVSLE